MLEAQTFYSEQLEKVNQALSTVTSAKFRAHLLRAKRIFEFEMGQSKEKYMQIMASSTPPNPETPKLQSSEQTPPQLSLDKFIKTTKRGDKKCKKQYKNQN